MSQYPKRFRARKRGDSTWYYYDAGGKPRKEIPLGCDYYKALQQWASLEGTERLPAVVTFRHVAEQYAIKVIPRKAPRTQKDNATELLQLYKFFDRPPCPLDQIQPMRVKQYVRWRTDGGAAVRAIREKALLSHVWNWAREEGYTVLANPCAGIRGTPGRGRDIYVEDDVFEAIRNAADQPTRDAMDLAYLTGQRPADALRMTETHIREEQVQVKQGKTQHKLRIDVTGELKALLDRISARKRELSVHALSLIINEKGQPLTQRCLSDRFKKARAKAMAEKKNEGMVDALRVVQFRDLRAKAGTDKNESLGMRAAQEQLGHSSMRMTEHYVRHRKGSRVKPTR